MYLMKKEPVARAALKDAEKLARVQLMLTSATVLELATLPTYLTGVFSVKSGLNQDAKNLVTSVAVEEMLHMSLAANILIAVGGSIDILKKGQALQFPTPLPGGVDEGVIVELTALTKEQVSNVYMEIERPETTAILPGESAVSPLIALKQEKNYDSIGDFYMEILTLLEEIPDVFAKPRLDRQVDLLPWFPKAVPGVPDGKARDLASAQAMIDTIIAQGEGAQISSDPIDPTGGRGGSYAHYFKFGEIYNGRQLVQDASAPSGWSYTGKPVPLDPKGIYNLLPNAGLNDYAPGSGARVAGAAFYEAYLRLLTSLNQCFNGQPDNLGNAIGLMYELKLVADRVMLFPADESNPDGPVAAPPFQLDRNPQYGSGTP